jgi:hypothetical protein
MYGNGIYLLKEGGTVSEHVQLKRKVTQASFTQGGAYIVFILHTDSSTKTIGFVPVDDLKTPVLEEFDYLWVLLFSSFDKPSERGASIWRIKERVTDKS